LPKSSLSLGPRRAAGRSSGPRAGVSHARARCSTTAPFLASAADRIATLSELEHSFVGTTLLALTTSLPELVATLAAARLGSFDLALGNIFGSNSFNMLLLVPLDLLQPGPLLSLVRPLHAVTAFGVVLATSVAVMAQLYRFEKRKA
jgi:cation:H+ antiporter